MCRVKSTARHQQTVVASFSYREKNVSLNTNHDHFNSIIVYILSVILDNTTMHGEIDMQTVASVAFFYFYNNRELY